MKVFLFTNNYPYANSETFLENEIKFLSNSFDQIIIIPLEKKGERRPVPQNTQVWDSILSFDMKNKFRLLLNGIFCFSPLGPVFNEFIRSKVYLSKAKIWKFFTYSLLFRAIQSNKSLSQKIRKEILPEDILYFYWGDKSVMLLPHIKRFCISKTFVRFHGSDLYENIGSGLIPFRRYILNYIDAGLFISNNGKKYFIDNYGDKLVPQLIVSRLGVPSLGINPIDKENYFHIVSCSNMVPLKRLTLIISALQLLEEKVCWTHIGAGPEMKLVLERSRRLPGNIKVVLTGAMSNKDVVDFYMNNHIDLFVNVSETEGVPVSIMEALSCGIPILATDVGGTSEIVDNMVGRLVDKNISDADLAEGILFFYNNHDLDTYRQNAIERWRELCDAERNYFELSQIFKDKK